jgi:hypothetical protein
MTVTPARASGRPTGVISNTPRGDSPAASRRPLTTRLVEVPSSVMTPPRIEA